MQPALNSGPALPDKIKELHSIYESLTSFTLRLDMAREHDWFNWAKRFDAGDLRLVLGYLQREIKAGNRRPGCLRFSNLIVQLDYFEENLSLAKHAQRARTQKGDPGRNSILKSTGRTIPAKDRMRSVDQVIADMKALREFSALKKSL